MARQYRFIEASLCPMISTGGWMVSSIGIGIPPATVTDARAHLSYLQLEEGTDYKIIGQGWKQRANGYEALKRVVFFTDEAFIMAKMLIA